VARRRRAPPAPRAILAGSIAILARSVAFLAQPHLQEEEQQRATQPKADQGDGEDLPGQPAYEHAAQQAGDH
jgi:hypothetical protein